jgi:hypothetical protein
MVMPIHLCYGLLLNVTILNLMILISMYFLSEVIRGSSILKKSGLKSEKEKRLRLKLLSKYPLLNKIVLLMGS